MSSVISSFSSYKHDINLHRIHALKYIYIHTRISAIGKFNSPTWLRKMMANVANKLFKTVLILFA